MQCEDLMKRYFRTTFPLSAVAIFLAGCTNPAQFDDRNSYEKTKQGALIGGVLGAMGGLITGNGDDKNQRAIKGAILGSGFFFSKCNLPSHFCGQKSPTKAFCIQICDNWSLSPSGLLPTSLLSYCHSNMVG